MNGLLKLNYLSTRNEPDGTNSSISMFIYPSTNTMV